MNEPVVPGGKGKDWLGPAFGDKHYRPVHPRSIRQIGLGPTLPRQWIKQLSGRHFASTTSANDNRGPLVDWSLDRPGLTSGSCRRRWRTTLDFVSVHLYPKKGKVDERLKTWRAFAVGKPVLIEETFPLACSPEELEAVSLRVEEVRPPAGSASIGASRPKNFASPKRYRMC